MNKSGLIITIIISGTLAYFLYKSAKGVALKTQNVIDQRYEEILKLADENIPASESLFNKR